jgi:hypothetical protein
MCTALYQIQNSSNELGINFTQAQNSATAAAYQLRANSE